MFIIIEPNIWAGGGDVGWGGRPEFAPDEEVAFCCEIQSAVAWDGRIGAEIDDISTDRALAVFGVFTSSKLIVCFPVRLRFEGGNMSGVSIMSLADPNKYPSPRMSDSQ